MIRIDPAEVAKLLTPNQKMALLWLPADGSEQIDVKNKRRLALYGLTSKSLAKDVTACLAASRADSGGLFANHAWHATDLGLKVRRAIETKPD